jgi:hypothetical protein
MKSVRIKGVYWVVSKKMSLRFAQTIKIGTVITGLFLAPGCQGSKDPDPEVKAQNLTPLPTDSSIPFATREGSTILLQPSGCRFQIPLEWVALWDEHKNNLFLDQPQLKALELLRIGEWDGDYIKVCNAVFPLDRCVAHVGGRGFGPDREAVSNLQLRIYDVLESPEKLEQRVLKAVGSAIKVDTIEQEIVVEWRRVLVSYTRQHFDYGGIARVDFRIRRFGKRSLIFVFLHHNDLDYFSKQIAVMLDSTKGP